MLEENDNLRFPVKFNKKKHTNISQNIPMIMILDKASKE